MAESQAWRRSRDVFGQGLSARLARVRHTGEPQVELHVQDHQPGAGRAAEDTDQKQT